MKNSSSGTTAHNPLRLLKQLSFPILFLSCILGNKVNAQSVMAKLTIHLLYNTTSGSANTADGCMMLYKTGFLNGLGPEDSYKFTNVDENIALPCGNSLLSVEGKSPISGNDTIPLKIWQYTQTSYYLEFDGSNFPPTLAAVLKDNYLQQDKLISLSGKTLINYTITADSASAASDRFCVILEPASMLPLNLLSFTASSRENGILISWTNATETGVDHYEIEKSTDLAMFTKAASIAVASNVGGEVNHQWLDINSANGFNYYRLKSFDKSGQIAYSRILKVAGVSKPGKINVYPNPVTGNKIGLQIINLEAGNYQVSLYKKGDGVPVYNTQLQHQGGNDTKIISIEKYIARGNYILTLGNGKKVYSQSVIIN